MSKIGIAISTRNRQAHLKMCLAHFVAYYPSEHNVSILVCDDNSQESCAAENNATCEHWGIDYHYHQTRIGVAANKNFGLSAMMDNDVTFLFDDDCFPNDASWVAPYIDIMNQNNVHHLTYTPWMPSQRVERDGMYISEWGMGCCMFFSRQLITKIGGFDEKYHMFGFEHLAYGRRAFISGMNQDYGAYLTPIDAVGKIFTLDYEYKSLKQQPSMGTIDFEHTRTAHAETPGEEVGRNRQLFDNNEDQLYVGLPQYKA
jgi:GT2 family glycosyltransferase